MLKQESLLLLTENTVCVPDAIVDMQNSLQHTTQSPTLPSSNYREKTERGSVFPVIQLIAFMKKKVYSDWLGAVQFKCNTGANYTS